MADLLVDLPAADHHLDMRQPGILERLDGGLHRVVGQGQEAAHSHNFGPALLHRFDEFGRRHIHAQVGNFEAVDIQHKAHDVFGNIVNIPLHRAQHHLA